MMMTEARIRELLVAKLSASAAGQGAAFISELFVDGFQRRADLVMANGSLAAFEIKSERDTLDRLDGQLECYQRLFELVTVVCAQRHLNGVLERAPTSVGVWVVSEAGRVTRKRAALKGSLPPAHWISHLPVDELQRLLRASSLTATGARGDLAQRAATLPVYEVRRYVLDFLKRRDRRIEQLKRRRSQSPALAPSSTQLNEERLQAFLKQAASLNMTATPRRIPGQSSPSRSSSS